MNQTVQEDTPQREGRQGMIDIVTRILLESVDRREQGTRFEQAVAWFLRHDPAWTERITAVWPWDEAPTNDGQADTGIDLVGLDADGSYWAIQAKCYSKAKLAMGDVSTFFAKSLIDDRYQHYMIADTAAGFTSTLEDYINDYPGKDIVRLDLDTMRDANIDWGAFIDGTQASERKTYDPRPHQREAIDAVETELAQADRCSLIMACGTGKTLTALRLTEEMVGDGGTILFLAPSISLVSQSMRDWVNQTRSRINVYVVCSDGKASKVSDEAYGRLSDIPFPATTNPLTVAQRFKVRDDALNVVFSTYQSIQVIHDAQQLGLTDFDLTICDEAHRTTGVMDGETAFQKVHDPDFIRSAKRLYMTATPRIFSENAKNKADAGAIEIASMDDESLYGKVAYRLGFGQSVDRKLLTDYKIVVMQVSEDMMGRRMQEQYGRADSEIPLDDAAKFVGCWKALFDRRHAKSVDDLLLEGTDRRMTVGPDDTKRVLHHAIAFAPSIKASKALTAKFRAVIDDYTSNLEQSDENQELLALGKEVTVGIDHVDGTMDAQTRKTKLDWLAAEIGPAECHILSNARCLAEGVDVPSLDAIIYLSSRKSKVDIIQSVGRVMRRAPGKEYGYIIIPVVVPLGADPDTVISSGAFKPVWEVVTALRSHDERLDAIINEAGLGDTDALSRIIEVDVLDESRLRKPKKKKAADGGCGGYPGDPDESGDDGTDGKGSGSEGVGPAVEVELDLDISEMAKAINAQIVRRCGTKIYWNAWTDDIATITRARARHIANLVETEPARTPFLGFLDGLRASLNPGYSETDAIAVLAQHEITRPIFATLFTNQEVLDNNPIVRGLDLTMDALYEAGLEKGINSPTLRELYSSVRLAASQLRSDVAKQNLIKEIYNEFFTKAFKDTAKALGIVYTPVEVVDAQLHMVQRALQREFGQSLGDKGVHILDGFAGTGTYLCRLIEDTTLISDDDLPYKYENDLHSNEIVPLAATIMDINIEQSYHKRIGGEYRNFPGALLTDTFQMHEQDDTLDDDVFTENTERVQAQKNLPIRVIIGNPPYNVAKTDLYPTLKKRIEETYSKESEASSKRDLYNSYYFAMRWASDRIGDAGIVCFVSGGGWIKGNSGAGVRKCFVNEFNDIYVYDLRGDKEYRRLTKEQLEAEGDNIFASGSKSPIVISLLVRNPESSHQGVVHYCDIGSYLSLDEKKKCLTEIVSADPDWKVMQVDKYGDWFDKRDDSFEQFMPMALEKEQHPSGIFWNYSLGLNTNRDAWVYNFNKDVLSEHVQTFIDVYNENVERCEASQNKAEYVFDHDDSRIKWSSALEAFCRRGVKGTYDQNCIVLSQYRPFCKKYVYFNRLLNQRVSQQKKFFPNSDISNIEICISEKGVLVSNVLPDLELIHGAQCFPLYWYEEINPEKTETGYNTLFSAEQSIATDDSDFVTAGRERRYVRHDAITDTALRVFRKTYPHTRITKEDIFYYIYGVFNSLEYRRRFENNLKKELPRIPLAKDFKVFMKAGRELADLHLNYENVDRWPLMEQGDKANPGRTEKMTYPATVKDPETGKQVPDKTILKVAENLTIHGIPLRAYEYVVNGKSAIGWIVDRYRVTVDKKSGIVNDPNEYCDDPRYIVDLVERVITVSMRTLDIVDGLPPLDELPQPADWPSEWR